ncbi:MAG TPA: POTRA domain-containing protein, partial [Isosphaeraceae bacterium]
MAPTARATALAALAALALLVTRAGAAVPEGNVTQVRIEGNSSITEEQIRAKLLSRPGRPLDQATVEADIKSLNATKWFSDAKAYYDPDPAGKGFVLIYQVREMPILKVVQFRGRGKVALKDLEENTGLKAGARADHVRTLAAVRQIRQLYEDKGYELAEVRLIEGGKPGDTTAVFEIFEGPKFKVGGIAFEGNTVFSDATLRTKIGSRTPILGLVGGRYHKEGPEEDARKLIDYYHGLGYFEAKVTPVVRSGSSPGDLRLTFVISEGIQYKVRDIRFEGNEKIPTDRLREGLVLHSGQPFSDSLRELDATNLREKYSRIGCIDIQIQPEPSFTDTPGVVDLVYQIEEGDQYLLGLINVWGNARTRDKVIRREFVQGGLLPGEPLDGTRIENTRKRLGNLQYFVTAPDQGKPIDIKIVNRRPPDRPYGDVAAPDLDAVVRTRLQSPGLPEVNPSPDDDALRRSSAPSANPQGEDSPERETEVAAGVPTLSPSPLVGEGRGGGDRGGTGRSVTPTGQATPHPNPPPRGGRGPDQSARVNPRGARGSVNPTRVARQGKSEIELRSLRKTTKERPREEGPGGGADGDVVRTRLQNADEPPPIPLPPVEPLAPGPGPAGVVPFGSEGAFDPQVDAPPVVPTLPVPGPPRDFPPLRPGRQAAPPVGAGEPPGTFPSLPGSNQTDVGPDIQEPFKNRS